MAMYDQDSDVVQWGLRLFEGDPAYNYGYYGEMVQHDDGNIYHGPYLNDHYSTECSHIENDEIIAHTLQEEFSQLAIKEASGYTEEEEQFQEPVALHEWHTQRDYYSGHEYGLMGASNIRHSSSCSSPAHGEETSYSLELTEEYASDDEASEALNQIVFIPHVPRINGEIPSIDEATSDHQRLLDRLQLYDFTENKVQGDGNCQFRALSDQLYHTQERHEYVRQQIVSQLRSHPEAYEGYVPMAYDEYLEKMSRSGEWGDHVTLQAAADSFEVKIFLMTSFKDTCCIEILPNLQKSKRVIFLSFWAEVHYNSIYPQGASADSGGFIDLHLPSCESRKKKRWWIFRNKH